MESAGLQLSQMHATSAIVSAQNLAAIAAAEAFAECLMLELRT